MEDLLRWSEALETDVLLARETKALMWTPVEKNYGYGWQMLEPSPETLGRRVRMHSGHAPGFLRPPRFPACETGWYTFAFRGSPNTIK